jgi:transcriptional regulator with XRE-family HTH domain
MLTQFLFLAYYVSMGTMTNHIREAIRIELARRDWNKSRLADEAGVSRQYVSELMGGKAGNLSPAWEAILDKLGLELTVRAKDSRSS